jgi:pimeloyl-ACP methyl ester carboxylesterase
MPEPRDAYVSLPEREGLRLHYIEWGPSTPAGAGLRMSGISILLLHGLSSSARIWDLMAPLLTDKYHVIAVDQRSHGQSDRPDDGYDFPSTTADVAALIGSLGLERPVVVGHSWGANVALQLAHDYMGLVRGVVLVDGGFIERSKDVTWEQAEKEMRPPDIDGTPVERFVSYVRNFPAAKDIDPAKFEEMILSNFIVRDGKVYRPLAIPNHMKIARAIFDQRPSELLPNVKTPVLIVPAVREGESEQEKRWQEYRERGLSAIREVRPDIRVVRMEDTVHDVPVQRPKELAKVIAEFASELAAD